MIPEFATNNHIEAGQLATAAGFQLFAAETDQKLAALTGDPADVATFAKMPVTVIGYSSGYLPMTAAVEGLGSSVHAVEDLEACIRTPSLRRSRIC